MSHAHHLYGESFRDSVMFVNVDLQPWRSRQHVASKRWYVPTSPHSVTTQKTNTDSSTAVRTPNFICSVWFEFLLRPDLRSTFSFCAEFQLVTTENRATLNCCYLWTVDPGQGPRRAGNMYRQSHNSGNSCSCSLVNRTWRLNTGHTTSRHWMRPWTISVRLLHSQVISWDPSNC
jgi:hypothetical protein